jgi:acetyl esterase/lipase
MKFYLALLPLLIFNSVAMSQSTNDVILLWPDGAPGALGKEDKDIPTLTEFIPYPEKVTGAALVICPGGGYGGLAPHEGKEYALWLRDQGVACFVLKYRLGSAGYRHPIMLEDVSRAVRLVRANAAAWKLDPKHIGIMGSSAGGHLASTLMTHFEAGDTNATDPIERESSRPDIGILCYPVITMGDKTHAGSRNNLLGTNAPPELVQLLSNELHVTKDTPPCFIFHTVEDAVVPVENSLEFAAALRRAGVPFDLHIYQKGLHGSGLGGVPYSVYDPAKMHPWTRDCIFWLQQQGFVK